MEDEPTVYDLQLRQTEALEKIAEILGRIDKRMADAEAAAKALDKARERNEKSGLWP